MAEPPSRRATDPALELMTTGLERDLLLRDNVVIGKYAEALVAHALQGELSPHGWEAWDVVGPDGRTIQVKSSTAWAIGRERFKADPAPARWSGFKPVLRWDVETGEYESQPSWHADVWVLARVDGLDVFDWTTWSFAILCREDVQSLGAMSVGAPGLATRGHLMVGIDDLPSAYDACGRP